VRVRRERRNGAPGLIVCVRLAPSGDGDPYGKLEITLCLGGQPRRLGDAARTGSAECFRRPPVLPFLDRNNFLNRKLGKVRYRVLQSLGR